MDTASPAGHILRWRLYSRLDVALLRLRRSFAAALPLTGWLCLKGNPGNPIIARSC